MRSVWEDLAKSLEDGFDYAVASDWSQWDDFRGEEKYQTCNSDWFHDKESIDALDCLSAS